MSCACLFAMNTSNAPLLPPPPLPFSLCLCLCLSLSLSLSLSISLSLPPSLPPSLSLSLSLSVYLSVSVSLSLPPSLPPPPLSLPSLSSFLLSKNSHSLLSVSFSYPTVSTLLTAQSYLAGKHDKQTLIFKQWSVCTDLHFQSGLTVTLAYWVLEKRTVV